MSKEVNLSSSERVDSWVLSMVRYPIVLPQVSIVEVIPWVQPIITAKNLTWYLGAFPWRNLSVPLLSFDVMNGGNHSGVSAVSQIAIIKTIGFDNPEAALKFPYMAWIVQGKPRKVTIIEDEMANNSEVELGEFEGFAINLDKDVVVIPNLRAVESTLFKLLYLPGKHVSVA